MASYPFDLLRTTLAAQGEPKVRMSPSQGEVTGPKGPPAVTHSVTAKAAQYLHCGSVIVQSGEVDSNRMQRGCLNALVSFWLVNDALAVGYHLVRDGLGAAVLPHRQTPELHWGF